MSDKTAQLSPNEPTMADATQVLEGRLLTLASGFATDLATHVDDAHGALVVVGQESTKMFRKMRATWPSRVMLMEPNLAKGYAATEDAPFNLPTGGLFSTTLEEQLKGQINAGASLAITPSGYIGPKQPRVAKKLMDDANDVDRTDVIVLLWVHHLWCSDENIRQLIAIARQSKHPIALALADSDADPMSYKTTAAAYVNFFREVPNAIAWRADLAGLVAVAEGAPAAAVGLIPSLRRAPIPGKQNRSNDKDIRNPSVLLSSKMRYTRSHVLRQWYASVAPPLCYCPACNGQPIDRFTDNAEHHFQAQLHNMVAQAAIHAKLLALPAEARHDLVVELLGEAEIAHEALKTYTSVDVVVPRGITKLATALAVTRVSV